MGHDVGHAPDLAGSRRPGVITAAISASSVQPALTDFYAGLDDDQKARFCTMGAQAFAQNR
jgi:hypothetical protein